VDVLQGNYPGNTYSVKYEFLSAGKLASGTLTCIADDPESVVSEVYRILGVDNWIAADPADRTSTGSLPEYSGAFSIPVPAGATNVTVSEVVRKGTENSCAIIASRIVVIPPGPPILDPPVYNVVDHSVLLNWVASVTGDPVSYYAVYRGKELAGGVAPNLKNFIQIGTSISTTFADYDFDSAGKYYYYVVGYNKGGASGPSAISTVVTVYDTSMVFASLTASASVNSTTPSLQLIFTTPFPPSNDLAVADITLSGVDGVTSQSVAPDPANSGPDAFAYVLVIRGQKDSGTVTAALAKTGFSFSPASRQVAIAGGLDYALTADGATGTATTKLTFTFTAAVAALTTADITISNGTKGAVTQGTGNAWEMLYTAASDETITVSITKTGVVSKSKTVAVFA
jgi:hypothetical protein